MRKHYSSKSVTLVFLSILMATTSMAAPVPMENLAELNGTHIAVLYTKVLVVPNGLCINAALNFAITGLSFVTVALLTTNFKKERVVLLGGMAEKSLDKPLHLLGMAVSTGVAIATATQGFQNFIAAVQSWYATPSNIKPVED